jgi:histidine triad (HIT) family protein
MIMEDNIRQKCIFCRIADREIPSLLLWEDEDIVAFADLYPKAPLHILIIPRKHIASLNELTADDSGLIGKVIYVASQLAKDKGVAADGWRLVCNCGKNAGQEVFHLHFHLLGGKYLGSFCEDQ